MGANVYTVGWPLFSGFRAFVLIGLHTLIGMIGYCLKDEDLAHFATVDFNVTEDEKAKGRDTHMCEGQGHLKKRQSLTQVSVFDR